MNGLSGLSGGGDSSSASSYVGSTLNNGVPASNNTPLYILAALAAVAIIAFVTNR